MLKSLPHRRFLHVLLALTLLLPGAGCAHRQSLALPKPGRGPAVAPLLPAAGHQPTAEEREFWTRLVATNVIYICETHDRDRDHEYQFDVLRGLRSRGIGYTIGWEMFEAGQQGLVDAWQRGELPLEGLFEKVGWQGRWGKLSGVYEKMLRWSRQEGVENLALNAPAGLASKLGRGEALDAGERELIPAGYRPLPGGFEHFSEQMGQNPHAGTAAGGGLQNYYRAQLLWDQTMAERIVGFLRAHPEGKLVVLLGRGHAASGFGVPAFVKQKSDARQLVLYPGETPEGGDPARPGRLAGGHRPRHGSVRLGWLRND